MTIEQFLAEQGLTPEEVQAVIGNPKQAAAMSKALARYEEGHAAITRAEAEKAETAQFWEQKTQELQGSVQRLTAAERRAAAAEADAARVKAYNKSLADQGYDVPKEMYEGHSEPVKSAPEYVTREDITKMARSTAPDLVSLITLSNEYADLYGTPYLKAEEDFAEAQKSGKPFREYARTKYQFDAKRGEKSQKAEQERIDAIVNEKVKAKETELAAKYGSNSNLSVPMPSKFDKLKDSPGFKTDAWKTVEGRKANRADRLKRFENATLQ